MKIAWKRMVAAAAALVMLELFEAIFVKKNEEAQQA